MPLSNFEAQAHSEAFGDATELQDQGRLLLTLLWVVALLLPLLVLALQWLPHPPFGPPDWALFFAALLALMGLGLGTFAGRLRRSEQRLQRVLAQPWLGELVFSAHGLLLEVSPLVARLSGYSALDLSGHPLSDLLPAAEFEDIGDKPTPVLAGELRQTEMRCQDGQMLAVELVINPLPGERWQLLLRDLSEGQRSQQHIRQSDIVFDNAREAIMITDAQARVTTVNPAFTTITGYTADEVIGLNPHFQNSGRHDAEFFSHMWQSLTERGHWQGEIWNRRKNGELFPSWQTISAVKNASGQVENYVALFSDIHSLKNAEERLHHLAHHDALTGLPNRLLFANDLARSIERAKRGGKSIALLFLDLDHFKLINDTMGHAVGDKLLHEIARRLRNSVRAQDAVARLGGDEFTVALEDVGSPDDAASMAHKIIAALSEPMQLEGNQVTISPSIGIAFYPADGACIEDLTRAADAAMYRAKQHGRKTFAFYSTEIMASAVERVLIERGLRAALSEQQLELFYQPQVDMTSGRIVGMEALLRWHHPERGLVQPDAFIGVAEETGLISEIGRWVILQGCRQAKLWREQGFKLGYLWVNVSPRQILHNGIEDSIAQAMHENQLPGDSIKLGIEITESLLQSMPQSVEVLSKLRGLGVRIAIDDFGTGFSSLGLLKHLPIDVIKIDKMFVRHLAFDGDSQAITAAMISMTHTLGMGVVAEGVETSEQMDFLREQHCDIVQGFLFGAPLNVPQATMVLARHRDGWPDLPVQQTGADGPAEQTRGAAA
ncbi:EAL domain-containing protein [Paucibacter sp. B2R-40]|uniref:putative bifunctional diguanylate cyclase/phosphodiesterase n=1 Tax=Paucibacter sp. B2R-40 TaxID=2893554 RepID=UPI0021E49801|nr:EAL domain-containing protein [Paucibacter sp. B2R-40]MCV2355632.1 EAL domain-containing protein [Paucibacter sp. B2R-40]